VISDRQQVGQARTTRAELLEAGFQLLRTEGPSALRVRRVAEQANCSTMGVYTWFGDKDGLVEALWLDCFRRFGEALNAPARTAGGLDRIRELMETYRRWALDNPIDYQLMFGRSAPEYAPTPAAREQASTTFTVLLHAMAEAQAVGMIRDGDVHEMAIQLWGAGHGLIEVGMSDISPVEVDLDRVYREAVDAILLGLSPR
jgi:AcrR family transcriptional regulator